MRHILICLLIAISLAACNRAYRRSATAAQAQIDKDYAASRQHPLPAAESAGSQASTMSP